MKQKNGSDTTLSKKCGFTLDIAVIFHYNIVTIAYIAANALGWHNWSRKGFLLFAILDSIVLFAAGFLLDCVREWSYKLAEKKILRMLR